MMSHEFDQAQAALQAMEAARECAVSAAASAQRANAALAEIRRLCRVPVHSPAAEGVLLEQIRQLALGQEKEVTLRPVPIDVHRLRRQACAAVPR